MLRTAKYTSHVPVETLRIRNVFSNADGVPKTIKKLRIPVYCVPCRCVAFTFLSSSS